MDFNSLVKSALNDYGVDAKKTYLLRHNENYTVKVLGFDGSAYVLRIHLSNNKMQGIGQHSYEALLAEAQILRTVGENTDIKTQMPVANKSGDFVSRLKNSEGGELFATLLSFIPGEPLYPKAKDYMQNVFETGKMLAELHNFSSVWKAGHKLRRPKFDDAYLDANLKSIYKGIGLGLMDKKQFDIISEATERIKEVLCELEQGYQDTWYGISHCDVSNSNLIAYNGTVTPIDFSLSCLTYFFADLAGFIAELPDDEHIKAFIRGYRELRPLPKELFQYIEVFFVHSIFGFMALHVLNENMHEWFGRRLDAVLYDYVIPMIGGERFLL